MAKSMTNRLRRFTRSSPLQLKMKRLNLPKVKVMIHEYEPGNPFRSDLYPEPKFDDHFRHNAYFIGPNVRDAVSEGRADYTPIFLSELPALPAQPAGVPWPPARPLPQPARRPPPAPPPAARRSPAAVQHRQLQALLAGAGLGGHAAFGRGVRL